MDIVILGSCRHSPYNFIAVPVKVEGKWNTEDGYKIASEKFYPAIDRCDEVWVYLNEDNDIGEHTQRDLGYTLLKRKKVKVIVDKDYFDELQIAVGDKLDHRQ